jgi:hypothetical protein
MVAAQPIRRPLRPLRSEEVTRLPAQLGVYEIVGADGVTLLIGQAGATERFGLRSALGRHVDVYPGASFRHECTHGYRSRWQELLMLHQATCGGLPPGNDDDARLIGRLR